MDRTITVPSRNVASKESSQVYSDPQLLVVDLDVDLALLLLLLDGCECDGGRGMV